MRLELFAPSLTGGTVVSRKSYTTGHEANFKVIEVECIGMLVALCADLYCAVLNSTTLICCVLLQDVKQLRAVMQQHLLVHNAPVLIDNGTAAFAIAGMRRTDGLSFLLPLN